MSCSGPEGVLLTSPPFDLFVFILRLQVFRGYMLEVLASGRLLRYPQESQGERHIIHFSIAILIGYAIAMEVSY